jgi:hypothetical protein
MCRVLSDGHTAAKELLTKKETKEPTSPACIFNMPEDNPLIWETQTYGYERSRNSF